MDGENVKFMNVRLNNVCYSDETFALSTVVALHSCHTYSRSTEYLQVKIRCERKRLNAYRLGRSYHIIDTTAIILFHIKIIEIY